MEYCEIFSEQRWSEIENDLTKMMKKILGESDPSLELEDHMHLYTTIYDICTQKPPYDYAKQLYEKYGEVIEDYIKQTVLPSLREKKDEYMLRELVQRWSNVKCLSRCFDYVDRYFVTRRSLPSLKGIGSRIFRDLVYHEMHSKALVALVAQIREEREGKEIDRALMKNVLDVLIENGMRYEEDFESFMILDTVSYYSRMATRWIGEVSCPDYMIKAEECLKRERERVSHYLNSSTEPKLIEKVQTELLVVVAKRLLENENSGCHALLKDDKMDDLSRMFRLYHKIPQGLEPIAEIFKKHVTAEGNVLIKQAEDDAATNQVLIGKVTEVHDKYMVYLTECFQNHTLFHKALKEAFEIFCDESVAGSSSTELLAMFCK